MIGNMSKDIFYQVLQNGQGVGYFRKKSKALKYVKQFNTRVAVSQVKIVERRFIDDELESDFYDGGVDWDAWGKSP